MGRRTVTGWVVDSSTNFQAKFSIDYVAMLTVNGSTATLKVGTTSVSFTFAQRIDSFGFKHGLNDGVTGIGAKGGTKAQIDDMILQAPPGAITFDKTVGFGISSPEVKQPANGTQSNTSRVLVGRLDAGLTYGERSQINDALYLILGRSQFSTVSDFFKTVGPGRDTGPRASLSKAGK